MSRARLPVWLRAGIKDEQREHPLTKIVLRERQEEIVAASFGTGAQVD